METNKSISLETNAAYAGTGERAASYLATGEQVATKEIIIGLISNATIISNITNNSNWTDDVYGGPAITVYEGQYYFDSNYKYEANTDDAIVRISLLDLSVWSLSGSDAYFDGNSLVTGNTYIADVSTYLSSTGSPGQLTFTDAVTGTKTLAELAAGGGGGSTTFLGLTDTPSTYTENQIYYQTAVGLTSTNNLKYTASLGRLSTTGLARTVSASETNYDIASEIISNVGNNIATGTTDSGYRLGISIQMLNTDANFLGTLDDQTGMRIQYGHYTGAGAGTITDVYGIRLEGYETGGSTITNAYGIYQIGSSFTNYFGGNVGIGTTTPLQMLQVGDGTNAGKIAIGWNDSNTYSTGADATIYTSGQGSTYPFSGRGNLILQSRDQDVDGAGDIVFVTGATPSPKMIVSATGNVGIGTSTPVSILQITNGLKTEVIIGASGTASNIDSRILFNEGESGETDSLDYGFSLVYDGSGTGFGLPANTFGILRHDNNTSGAHTIVIERTTGDVGIGTDAPDAKLEVAGKVIAREEVEVLDAGGAEGFKMQWNDTSKSIDFIIN